jgi:CysZ protein
MLSAFALALGQLADRRIVRILAKSLAITLAIFTVLGASGWWLGDYLLSGSGLAPELRALIALAGGLVLAWLLWRVIALVVIQFFADEVVLAVEDRHYPVAAANARQLGWREELSLGLRGAWRAVALNLLALPVAAVLLVTGIGPVVVFWLVNAVLIGRELTELVWARHRVPGDLILPLGKFERVLFGGIVTALLAIPFVNLLAPVLGAAMATHLVHRKGAIHAR